MKPVVQRVAAVHDLSGFGRVSLTIIIPILSTMGVQVCPLPTAVLSTHTGGFENYKFVDLTGHLEEYIKHWSRLNIEFDCIYTGFLGSPRQIDIMSGLINDFNKKDQLVVIDPVLGDNGELYKSIDMCMVDEMKKFIGIASIITPNFTEAAFLLGKACTKTISEDDIKNG